MEIFILERKWARTNAEGRCVSVKGGVKLWNDGDNQLKECKNMEIVGYGKLSGTVKFILLLKFVQMLISY